jgi:hypothetical protein
MQVQNFEQNYHGVVQVEICFACAGIWFDHLASVQLAPAAVIELFKEINSHQTAARQPMATNLHCPRCAETLAQGSDLSKSGRFSYFRCPRGDGRFTPFFQFLREKQFVRTLTPAELQRVRSQVRQIKCSECGAPVDLEHSTRCEYCHAAISFLDPEAVEKAMRVWSEADNRRHMSPTPQALGEALQRMQLSHGTQASSSWETILTAQQFTGSGGLDLVAFGVHAIARLFDRRS